MRIIEEKNKKNREEIQNTALEIAKQNNNIILQYATGVGKTFAMIKIFDYFYNLNNQNMKCLILEPEISLIENVRKEFIKYYKTGGG